MSAVPVILPSGQPAPPRLRLATAGYPVDPERLPPHGLLTGQYEARFAQTPADLDQVLRLRFEVFNLELGEGLDSAYVTGRDEDELDERFHHLMIVHAPTGSVVGTYRMQTADMAAAHGGFYSAGEYRLDGVPAELLARSVEVGRACVAREHRNGRTLHLLWRGLASYLNWNRKSVLFGCCSLPGLDEVHARTVEAWLTRAGHMHPSVRVEPQADAACAPHAPADAEVTLPPLFSGYLSLGAKVWSPPAVDRLFKTIDFLVALDVNELHPRVYRSFFR